MQNVYFADLNCLSEKNHKARSNNFPREIKFILLNLRQLQFHKIDT